MGKLAAKIRSSRTPQRCLWAGDDPLMREYHDTEWGVPQRDGRALWEMLMLEGFQAGLAWIIVLRKREAFRKAFAGFDPGTVARFGEKDILRLMANPGIIRARAKIEATIRGAQIYGEMENRASASATSAGPSPMESRRRGTAKPSPPRPRSPRRIHRN